MVNRYERRAAITNNKHSQRRSFSSDMIRQTLLDWLKCSREAFEKWWEGLLVLLSNLCLFFLLHFFYSLGVNCQDVVTFCTYYEEFIHLHCLSFSIYCAEQLPRRGSRGGCSCVSFSLFRGTTSSFFENKRQTLLLRQRRRQPRYHS